MKRRPKIEKGISPNYEALWNRGRGLATLGQSYRCNKQRESDHGWAHMLMVAEGRYWRKLVSPGASSLATSH